MSSPLEGEGRVRGSILNVGAGLIPARLGLGLPMVRVLSPSYPDVLALREAEASRAVLRQGPARRHPLVAPNFGHPELVELKQMRLNISLLVVVFVIAIITPPVTASDRKAADDARDLVEKYCQADFV